MKYWLTTHWPARTDEPDVVDSGVWLPDGRESAGDAMCPGDLVAVYESQSGRNILKVSLDGSSTAIPRIRGKMGVVLYGEVISKISAMPDSSPEVYSNGTSIWWRWHTPLKVLSKSGYLSRQNLCRILGHSAKYNFHGYGKRHSGLNEITADEFFQIKKMFHLHNPIDLPNLKLPRSEPGYGEGGESEAHKNLKRYISSQPELALSEKGLTTIREEYLFITGDRADIILSDEHGRIIGLEVELNIDESDNSGPLQAIKYRRMLEYLTNRSPGDSRSILVAHNISNAVKDRCKKYGIETHEISKSDVRRWKSNIG